MIFKKAINIKLTNIFLLIIIAFYAFSLNSVSFSQENLKNDYIDSSGFSKEIILGNWFPDTPVGVAALGPLQISNNTISQEGCQPQRYRIVENVNVEKFHNNDAWKVLTILVENQKGNICFSRDKYIQFAFSAPGKKIYTKYAQVEMYESRKSRRLGYYSSSSYTKGKNDYYTQLKIPKENEPSFPCTKARTIVEKRICNSPYADLKSMDRRLSTSYKQAMSKAANPQLLKKEELQWLKERNECFSTIDPEPVEYVCSDIVGSSNIEMCYRDFCLVHKYQNRIQELKGY